MSLMPTRRPKFLGSKLKQIRYNYDDRVATQEEFALLIKNFLEGEFGENYSELNREYISGYERGTRIIPPVVLLAYAHLANVYVEVLIDDRLIIDYGLKIPFKNKYFGKSRTSV